MGGAKKAKSKGKVTAASEGAKTGQERQKNHCLRSAGLAAAVLCIFTDEVATDVIFCQQAMLLLQAGSDAGVHMARIQPFWKTLSAQSRMDLLSIPVAAAKHQAAELAAKQLAVVQTTLQAGRKGTKRGSAVEQGAPAVLQPRSWPCQD